MASLARSTAGRAVHLRLFPRPSSINESREVLRLLSQFGEVEYFKNLKYDTHPHPNASLVIFREEAAAQACLKRSPIRFHFGPEPEPEPEHEETNLAVDAEEHPAPAPAPTPRRPRQTPPPPPAAPKGPFGMPATRALSTSSLPRPPRASPSLPFLAPTQAPAPQPSRIFQLTAKPTYTSFRDAIDRSEYHGRFAVDGKSVIQQDLARRVPTVGLSCWDWRKGEKPDRIVQKERARREGRPLAEVWEEGARGGVD